MPTAVSIFLETPRNGQTPKNWFKTILFTRTADMMIIMYSIFNSFLGF
jgi:hypothetical protein